MSSEDRFQETLAMGIAAEDIVYNYLKVNNSLVQDMRKQTHEDNRGPRLIGTEGEIVLPDFAVYNKNPNKGNFVLDVKAKSSVYTINKKKYFTVDRKYEQYKQVRDIMKFDFLMMVFLFEDRMYFYRENETTETYQYSPNAYGDGFVYLFPFGSKKPTY
jgi:hypothetical protein